MAAVFTATSSSKTELQALADQYGGTVCRDGFLRWKLTVELDVPDEQADEFLARVQARWLDATGEVTVRKGGVR